MVSAHVPPFHSSFVPSPTRPASGTGNTLLDLHGLCGLLTVNLHDLQTTVLHPAPERYMGGSARALPGWRDILALSMVESRDQGDIPAGQGVIHLHFDYDSACDHVRALDRGRGLS